MLDGVKRAPVVRAIERRLNDDAAFDAEALEHGFISLNGCAETRLPTGNTRIFIRRAINVGMGLARFWRRDQSRLAAIARGHVFIVHRSLLFGHPISGRFQFKLPAGQIPGIPRRSTRRGCSGSGPPPPVPFFPWKHPPWRDPEKGPPGRTLLR